MDKIKNKELKGGLQRFSNIYSLFNKGFDDLEKLLVILEEIESKNKQISNKVIQRQLDPFDEIFNVSGIAVAKEWLDI